MRSSLHLLTRPALLAAGILGLTVSLGALSLAQGGRPGGGRSMAPPRPKNIKVLKDVPPGQLIPLMQNWSASLGVRCDFCHVGRAFEKDDKPEKATARKMALMVRDLNAHQKILGNKATCFMCHHGRPEPETQAPMPSFGRPGGGRPQGGGAPPPR